MYAGPEEDGKALIQPFLDLNPLVQKITMVPWNRLIPTSGFSLDDGFSIKGNIHSSYVVSARNISAPTLTDTFGKMVDFYQMYPNANGSSVEIQFYPNDAVVAVPENATAYPWRDVQAQMYVYPPIFALIPYIRMRRFCIFADVALMSQKSALDDVDRRYFCGSYRWLC